MPGRGATRKWPPSGCGDCFVMSKLVWFLVVAVLVCKLVTGRWLWEYFGASTGQLAEQRARNLLGVGKAAGRNEILEAHRRLLTTVHPDKGGTNDQVHEANAARDLLLAALNQR